VYNICALLYPFPLRSVGKFRPKSFFALGGKKKARSAISFLRFLSENALSIAKKLKITSEFNEVYFSERRNFER